MLQVGGQRGNSGPALPSALNIGRAPIATAPQDSTATPEVAASGGRHWLDEPENLGECPIIC